MLENFVKFLLISAALGFGFKKFIHFENHFGIFSNSGWCSWYSAFMYFI